MSPRTSRRPPAARRQRGAALLMALIIVTVVSTLAVTMVWQQWRAVQVETAERARQQAAWILTGALDWSRIILREDALAARRNRDDRSDHLGEPWAVPLAEARLSTFLAVDEANAEGAPDAFLSGTIVDAQARYNLANLIAAPDLASRKRQYEVLQRLCTHLNLSPMVAQAMLTGLQAARPVAASAPAQGGSAPATQVADDNAPLLPQHLDQFTWFGIDLKTLKAMAPYVVLLRDQDGNPVTTSVNANTASKEVLAAVLNVDLATAERLVQVRQRNHFKQPTDVKDLLPANTATDGVITTTTNFFFVTGRLRLDQQVLEQRSLVQRDINNLAVTPLSREWVSSQDPD